VPYSQEATTALQKKSIKKIQKAKRDAPFKTCTNLALSSTMQPSSIRSVKSSLIVSSGLFANTLILALHLSWTVYQFVSEMKKMILPENSAMKEIHAVRDLISEEWVLSYFV